MSKISKAIVEIEHLSQRAEQNQWVNLIHPLVKLFLTILYIVLVVSFPKYDLAGVCAMALYPIIAFNMADLSWKSALHRLRVVLPLVCIVGVFNPIFDREIVSYMMLGGKMIGISGGVLSMLSLMVKGVLTVLASYLLIATTTIEKVCYALRQIHVPKVMVTQILLIYRYITVMLEEVHRIAQAYSLRAPGQKGVHFKAWGSLVGQLLLRSMDRADDVYASMCLRGFSGEFQMEKRPFGGRDAAYLLFWTISFALIRIFPVFKIVGSLFM